VTFGTIYDNIHSQELICSVKNMFCEVLAVAGAVGGAVGVVTIAPVVIGAAGFTTAGVAAGSYAASLMSAAAIANGGTIAAGSTVAVLQSVGAAGLGLAGQAALGSAGAAVGAFATMMTQWC